VVEAASYSATCVVVLVLGLHPTKRALRTGITQEPDSHSQDEKSAWLQNIWVQFLNSARMRCFVSWGRALSLWRLGCDFRGRNIGHDLLMRAPDALPRLGWVLAPRRCQSGSYCGAPVISCQAGTTAGEGPGSRWLELIETSNFWCFSNKHNIFRWAEAF
jgi:hypothetical protein